MFERFNTHFSTAVDVTLFGAELRLAQDPNTNDLGSTVWDSSIVFAKFLERNSRRGAFSREKLKGKRVLELGAGMGLCGIAMCILGADVLLTGRPWANHIGKFAVQALDWNNADDINAAEGSFDYVVAADCVYNESHMDTLCSAILALTLPKSTVVITNELRSESVQSHFEEVFGEHFAVKKVPRSKMDANFSHEAISILLLKRKR